MYEVRTGNFKFSSNQLDYWSLFRFVNLLNCGTFEFDLGWLKLDRCQYLFRFECWFYQVYHLACWKRPTVICFPWCGRLLFFHWSNLFRGVESLSFTSLMACCSIVLGRWRSDVYWILSRLPVRSSPHSYVLCRSTLSFRTYAVTLIIWLISCFPDICFTMEYTK